jgi:hypothetical protein
MNPDPKEELKAPADREPLPSETVANAHASGDGSLERSEEKLEEKSEGGGQPARNQDHTPY